MKEMVMKQIGTIHADKSFVVQLEPEYAAGLTALEGFSHVLILWYADKGPVWQSAMIEMASPYRGSPDPMGVFATRSPVRPNGLCVSTAVVAQSDPVTGMLSLGWIDAADGSPVLDIKPYHPSEDRVLSAGVPDWCSFWPASYEQSSSFDWDSVFLF
jgi:tRNA (adenine37-N6)-methyltransferase